MSDDDLLESLTRDGHTLGGVSDDITPMHIAIAWIVGLCGGCGGMLILILIAWKSAKSLGLVA